LLSAHQFVVCIQSKFFDNAFRNFAEGETKTMNLDAATEAAYWRVFEYMYTGDYPDQLSGIETEGRRPIHLYYRTRANIRTDESEYLQDPRVYALADMYFLEDLKLLSEAKFRQNLKKIEIGDGFAECVREVYATTSESDKTMRSAVVEAAVSRRSAMTGSGKELIYGGGDFVVDYIEALRQYTY
jgi:hypothetical protein